jgi:hypothetical protein
MPLECGNAEVPFAILPFFAVRCCAACSSERCSMWRSLALMFATNSLVTSGNLLICSKV